MKRNFIAEISGLDSCAGRLGQESSNGTDGRRNIGALYATLINVNTVVKLGYPTLNFSTFEIFVVTVRE